MFEALLRHWPEYGMEAALLGGFMVSACLFGTLLEHPGAIGRRAIGGPVARRAIMGLAMGLTAVVLIYSPWGQRSGAHMNPATTLTFFVQGKVARWDALFYVIAQFLGGTAGVVIAWLLLRDRLRHESVNFVVTTPGRRGATAAWAAEWAISFGMMFTVLYAGNDPAMAPYTGWLAGGLLALYILIEAPLSGMSLNPARTFGSAVAARQWRAFWVYLTAPAAGMLLASAAYATSPVGGRVYCAKLDHCNGRRCIFKCEFERLRPPPEHGDVP
ncbi:MAG: aquaporin family protein [Phycisphaerales bacterium]|nr:MAG: aquaporin family protein [Phycisphaerales bacterium]